MQVVNEAGGTTHLDFLQEYVTLQLAQTFCVNLHFSVFVSFNMFGDRENIVC